MVVDSTSPPKAPEPVPPVRAPLPCSSPAGLAHEAGLSGSLGVGILELEPLNTEPSGGGTFFLDGMLELEPEPGLTRVVAPVGIDPNLVVQNPILGQILKNVTVPKFNNKPEDYWDWKWNLGRACDRIMQGKPMPESVKEIILESALPENLVLEYQVFQRMEKLGSTAFLARLDDRFGRGQPMLARLKLERLELKNMGKLKAQDIKHFEVQFYDALKNIGDTTEAEIFRILMCKLPEFLRQWVLEEQEKRGASAPIVEFSAVPGLSETNALNTITALVGEAPIGVKMTSPGKFLVKFSSLTVARKFTALQGRTFRGRPETLSAQIKEVKLTVPEIFELIQHKLKTREMASEFSPHRDFFGPQGRSVRESKRSKSPPPPQIKSPGTGSASSGGRGQGSTQTPSSYRDAAVGSSNQRQNSSTWVPVGGNTPTQKGKGGKGDTPYYPFKSSAGKGKGVFGGRGMGKGKGVSQANPPPTTTPTNPAPDVTTSSNSA